MSSLSVSNKDGLTFLDLPGEIRNEIYKLALVDHYSNSTWYFATAKFTAPETVWLHDPLQQPAFTLANHQIQQEGVSLMFHHMQHSVALSHGSSGRRPVHHINKRWMERVGGHIVRMPKMIIMITKQLQHNISKSEVEGLDGNDRETTGPIVIAIVALRNSRGNGTTIACAAGPPLINDQPPAVDPGRFTNIAIAAKIEYLLESTAYQESRLAGVSLADVEMIREFLEAREGVVDVPGRL